ncbi:MAG TPA: hypothetical protein DEB31_03465 [Clostridiales bacterium]|nr:hypothetical protein [Clostridiales bacterium]
METKVITDIGEYEENVLAGMTMRQAALSVIGVVVIVAAYMAAQGAMHMQAASYLAICVGLPCFLFAFARPRKKRLEEFLAIWIRFNFISHRKRVYRAENDLYDAVFNGDVKEPKQKKEEQNEIV